MNITHGLRRALQINPNGLASVFGNRRRHWHEIGERVPRLAAGLRSLGTNPGDRAGILVVDKTFASVGTGLAKALSGLKLIYADEGDVPVGMESYETLLSRSE